MRCPARMTPIVCSISSRVRVYCRAPRGPWTIGESGAAASEFLPRACLALRSWPKLTPAKAGGRELPSGVGLFEQPGHVLAEGLNGFEALFVLSDLAFGLAEAPSCSRR